jgi:hypothetical protein
MQDNGDLLKRHGSVNGDKAGNATDPKSNNRRQFLTASGGALAKLLEGRVSSKSYSGVSALTHHLGSRHE